MSVESEIDVTPEFTFSTVQFSNETLNAVVTSLLAVFILINIGSAVSKLIYFTRKTSFNYNSWNRAFIFANSDDPIRIISWLSRYYWYRDKKWNRFPNKLRLGRLFLPLLARLFILVVSIASIAVSVPGHRKLNGCQKGDYRLQLDNTVQGKAPEIRTSCIDTLMSTRLGKVRSTLTYCNCPFFLTIEDLNFPSTSLIVSFGDSSNGVMSTLIYSREQGAGHAFYAQWKAVESKGILFFSDLTKLDQKKHLEIVARAIRLESGQECTAMGEPVPIAGFDASLSVFLNCAIDSLAMIGNVEAYLRNAMTWERLKPGEEETRFRIDTTSRELKRTIECPIDVIVTRPIVNILPLAMMLLFLVVVNLIVSYATSRHGNALDAGFHIIKEALGHDCTSNPLEENQERMEVKDLELRKWRCGPAGAHAGFIGREGDIPVEDFDKSTIVCGCSRGAVELQTAATLAEVPVTPTAPESTSSIGIAQHQQQGVAPGAVPTSTGMQWQSLSTSVDGSQISGQPAWPPAGYGYGSHTGMGPPPPSS